MSSPEEKPDIGQESFETLLKRLGIGDEDADYVLIGDGSGSNWSTSAGWGCVSIDVRTGERQVWWGGMSKGTVNLAEMLAYIQPLSWITSERDRRRKEQGTSSFCKVHIVTDSQYCQKQGDKGDLAPKANGAMWRIFDDFERKGFVLTWHWMERETVELNLLADAVSKQARQQYVTPKGEEPGVLLKAHENASGLSGSPLTAYNPPEPDEPEPPPKKRKKRRKRR